MKRLVALLFITLSLTGLGCLDKALEYPKNPINSPAEVEKQEVSTTGIIRSIDSENNSVQIETTDGFIEEVKVNSSEGFAEGSLLEVTGWRDPSSLVIDADSTIIIDVEKIKIISPKSGATVISPLIIDGFAKISDQKLYWRIKDANNAVQLSGVSTIDYDNTNSYSTFKIEIYLPALESKSFTLEMFSKQPTEVGLVSVPLNLLSINTSDLTVYFSNNKLGSLRSCGTVFSVTRTVSQTSATGRAALIELLNGPSDSEVYQGYRSSIPYNTIIKSFVINGGVAKVVVSKDFTKTTTCERQRAEEQIKQTLLGIDSVEDVVIEVE